MLAMGKGKSGHATQGGGTTAPFLENPTGPDYGAELLNKRHAVRLEGDKSGRGENTHHARVVDQTVFDRLHHEGRIDDRKYAAGLRLLDSFVRAGMTPQLVVNFAREGIGSGRHTISAGQMAARIATNDALKAMGPLNSVVWDVVLADKSLTSIEVAQKWPKSTAFVVLNLGLEALANYYESLEKRR